MALISLQDVRLGFGGPYLLHGAIMAGDGNVFSTGADIIRAAFESPLDAVMAALEAQQAVERRSLGNWPAILATGAIAGTGRCARAGSLTFAG